MNMRETWLNESIQKAADIEHYKMFYADRINMVELFFWYKLKKNRGSLASRNLN